MRVSQFYQQGCLSKKFFSELDDSKASRAFYNVFKSLCDDLCKYTTSDALNKAYESLKSNYLDSYFSFSWQKDQRILDDMAKLKRFCKWLGNANIKASNVVATVKFNNGDLTTTVALIAEILGKPAAINIAYGKARSSFGGKSIHTNAYYDLYALVAKAGLEKEYPGIVVYNVYLTNDDDRTGKISSEFIINKTKKSNVFYYDFDAFYNAGVLNGRELVNSIIKVVKEPLKKDCFNCSYAQMCSMQPMSTFTVDNDYSLDDKNGYQIPSFTSSQKEVIDKVEGAVRVIAGPGSGKTATLVGRISHMIEKGIEPEFILAITFTREAAGELSKRCASFCTDMPKISTIHALCYEILRNNADLLGKEVKLLAQKDRLEIISGCLEAVPITGLNGDKDLPKMVETKLDKYFTKFNGDADAFLKEEISLGKDFIEFASVYDNLCKVKGYITFNEQISLCIELFKSHPEVLSIYSKMYKYIMVDEFQDIDASQWEFIKMLASHGNICVVGDDDQSIYAFRGGSNKYMLDFDKYYPAASTITLKENFRSTQTLVAASQNVIAKNKSRLNKEVTSGRGDKGVGPIYLNDSSSQMVEKVIGSLIKKGLSYKDIAVLSTKNSTLETLNESLSVPTILDKTILIKSSLFRIIYDVLQLYFSNNNNNLSFYALARLFGEKEVIADYNSRDNNFFNFVLGKYGYPLNLDSDFYNSAKENGYVKAIRLIRDCNRMLADVAITPAFFVQAVAFALEQEENPVLSQIIGIIEDNNITDIKTLSEQLSYMVMYADDTRVDVSHIDAVHLVTNHDSKGREFKAVVMVDDFNSEINEENRRLAYVAMTRAKDHLFILSDEEKNSIITELKKAS